MSTRTASAHPNVFEREFDTEPSHRPFRCPRAMPAPAADTSNGGLW